jgi:hypothetical protein
MDGPVLEEVKDAGQSEIEDQGRQEEVAEEDLLGVPSDPGCSGLCFEGHDYPFMGQPFLGLPVVLFLS